MQIINTRIANCVPSPRVGKSQRQAKIRWNENLMARRCVRCHQQT